MARNYDLLEREKKEMEVKQEEERNRFDDVMNGVNQNMKMAIAKLEIVRFLGLI